jgi:excisionase family DNA binding protein
MPPDSDPSELMTPAEARAALRVHPRTLVRWVETGQINAIRTLGGPNGKGGHRRYLRAEIEAIQRGDHPNQRCDEQ